MLSDVHCHLYAVEDAPSVVQESTERGLRMIVTNAEDVKTSEKNVELADSFDIVYSAVGIHPEFSLSLPGKELEGVERLISKKDVVAVGEIGLDYKFARSRSEKERQKRFFHKQLDMAREYDLPVIVHSRRAHRPVLDAILDYGVRADLHWFSGPPEEVERAVEGGIFFSFGPAVLQYDAYREMVDQVPLDLIMLETDTPVHFGGRPARPWWVRDVAEFIADVKNTSVETLMVRTWENARRFFRI